MGRDASLIAMDASAKIEVSELLRFARLAAPFLQRDAARGLGPRAARNRPGPGLEFLDLRYYEPGDDIRHIDWRQSARRQRHVVRRFRDETAADWFICADCSASVRLGGHKWPMTVRLASALAYALLYAGNRVALLLFSDRIDGFCHLGRGAHQFSELLDLLLRQEIERSKSASRTHLGHCRDYLTQDSNVFVISDFLEPDGMRKDLRSIRAAVASANALQVLAKDEMRIPATGITRLEDAESGRSKPFMITDQLQERAQSNLEAHCHSLRMSCAALDIRFATCNAGDRWEQVLLAHLNARR